MWRFINTFKDIFGKRLEFLYPDRNVDRILERIALVFGRYDYLVRKEVPEGSLWDEKSCVLITYGDMVTREDEAPLVTLRLFLREYLAGVVTAVHVLPFFPYSSDDGFSVIDYRQVNPSLGDWGDIRMLGENFDLMVDLVLNHVSSHSRWFQDYIGGIAPARDYFIEVDPDTDLSMVVRPRTSPLLTPVQTVAGQRWVWTTFSPDQVDLNYANPDLLMEMIDILLGYVANGAVIIRLDAIAYLWKEIGTTCLNLPQTHEMVRLLRDILDYMAPGSLVLTETNLPHEQNISYFGDGDEAHLVYQFTLPPLLLHTIHTGSSDYLQRWTRGLAPPPPGCTFLNFTASHDGIGVRPLEGLLSDEEILGLADTVRACGGLVSSRTGPDGGEQPYELNITYFDAMKDPDRPDDLSWQGLRFLCSQIIMLGMRGIPAIYFHSLTATRNNYDGVAATGMNRTINRGRWRYDDLVNLLNSQESSTARIFRSYVDLIRKRASEPAFHPDVPQELVESPDSLFVLVRRPEQGRTITCVHNVTPRRQEVRFKELGPALHRRKRVWDCIGEEKVGPVLHLEPYQCCWLAT